MNDFDRFLEFELRHMLDPVVAARAPRRIRRMRSALPFAAVIAAPIEIVAEARPAIEPVPIVP